MFSEKNRSSMEKETTMECDMLVSNLQYVNEVVNFASSKTTCEKKLVRKSELKIQWIVFAYVVYTNCKSEKS